MSAPQTNIDRQKRRHRGPLIGIAAAMVAALVIFAVLSGSDIEEPAVAPTTTETAPPGVPAPGN